MAIEVVVNQTLSDVLISAGAELTRLLEKRNFLFPLHYVLYVGLYVEIYYSQFRGKDRGPRWTYRHVQSVLSRIPNSRSKIALKDITVIDSDDPLIKLLMVAIKTGSGIHNLRVTRNIINSMPIEDAYIYRFT